MISAFSSPSPFAASKTTPDGLDTAAARHAETWLRRAKDGDSDAFACLCEQHRKRVWNVVASVTRKSADTDDLAQDALVRAWAALPSYKGDARVFGAWLCRIALNAAHDYQKSAWRRRVLVGFGNSFTGSRQASNGSADFCDGDVFVSGVAPTETHDEAVRRETARRVRAAVAGLAPKERVPIWLVYFETFSLADVARIENVPESTIRSRVKKGLSRLQKTLHDLNLTGDGAAVAPLSGSPAAAPLYPETRRDATPPLSRSREIAPPADWKGCVQL